MIELKPIHAIILLIIYILYKEYFCSSSEHLTTLSTDQLTAIGNLSTLAQKINSGSSVSVGDLNVTGNLSVSGTTTTNGEVTMKKELICDDEIYTNTSMHVDGPLYIGGDSGKRWKINSDGTDNNKLMFYYNNNLVQRLADSGNKDMEPWRVYWKSKTSDSSLNDSYYIEAKGNSGGNPSMIRKAKSGSNKSCSVRLSC